MGEDGRQDSQRQIRGPPASNARDAYCEMRAWNRMQRFVPTQLVHSPYLMAASAQDKRQATGMEAIVTSVSNLSGLVPAVEGGHSRCKQCKVAQTH